MKAAPCSKRRLTERVTILSAENDAVTLDVNVETHFPRRRTFKWRNTTFRDYDEDAEEYDDYHTIQGLPTALTITRYHNGEMASQTFYSKVDDDVELSPDTFNPDVLLQRKNNPGPQPHLIHQSSRSPNDEVR